jgi:hypothetical protein
MSVLSGQRKIHIREAGSTGDNGTLPMFCRFANSLVLEVNRILFEVGIAWTVCFSVETECGGSNNFDFGVIDDGLHFIFDQRMIDCHY